jgi:predicted ester cyclase
MASLQEQNKDIVRRFYVAFGEGNIEAIRAVMHEDFVDHGESLFGAYEGRALLEQSIGYMGKTFEGFNVYLDDMIADGDLVGVRGTMRCKNIGEWMGVKSQGNNLEWKGMAIFRIVDGKIKERWFNSDSLSIAVQMGAVKI